MRVFLVMMILAVVSLTRPAVAGLEADLKQAKLEFERFHNRNGAFRLLDPWIERGEVRAVLLKGMLIKDGIVFEEHFDQARELLERAYTMGSAEAAYQLGDMLAYPKHRQPDNVGAMKWYRLARGMGHPEASFNMGLLAEFEGKDFPEQLPFWDYYQEAVDDGHVEATYSLGEVYLLGHEGHLDADPEKAVELLIKAGRAGSADAYVSLAEAYESGKGLPLNPKRAMDFYYSAALIGHAPSIMKVAEAHLTGEGLPRNVKGAVKILKAAGDNGSGRALYLLGQVYEEGADPIESSPLRALSYYGRAAEAGYKGAAERYAALEKTINPPAPPTAPRSGDVALIIEIGSYDSSAVIPDVQPAASDAARMKEYFIERLGIAPENILHLQNPTLGEMVAALGNERSHKGRLHDMVRDPSVALHVYYVGHGAPGEGGKGSFLVPSDANEGRLELSGYPLDLLYSNLAKIPARSRTVVLEACFSGVSPAGSLFGNASPVLVQAAAHPPAEGITVYAAGASDQIASWTEKGEDSLFTRYFVAGMSGAADAKAYGNGDGKVTDEELRRYLADTVTYQARRLYGRTQEPQVLPATGRG